MDKSYLKTLDKETLVEIILSQAGEIEELRSQIKALSEQIKLSNQEIDRLQRASKRQAAPFRVEDHKKKQEPNPPGNKAGHKGYYRKFNGPVDETVEVNLESCPECGSIGLTDIRKVAQIVEEIPQVKVKVTRLITYKGHCINCNKGVSSSHPLKISNAIGSAGTYLGPNAKSLAIELMYKFGISTRKTADILKKHYGLLISPGGLKHLAHKASQVLEHPYENLKENLRNSQVIHADETSWYVGHPKYWLWVFTNATDTLYHIVQSRARSVLLDIIGSNYQGVLVSDCLSIYDDVNPHQQKCYAHHLKAISIAMDKVEDNSTDWIRLNQVKALLKKAINIKKVKDHLSTKQYQAAIKTMQMEADNLIPSQEEIKQFEQENKSPYCLSTLKLLNRLAKQRDHLFTFLLYEHVDATNNLAERRLRPAVISRKVSCGNKTDKGAYTWQTLRSLIQTALQQNKDFKNLLTQAYYQALLIR